MPGGSFGARIRARSCRFSLCCGHVLVDAELATPPIPLSVQKGVSLGKDYFFISNMPSEHKKLNFIFKHGASA
jgi:hypothetical protein